jgi:hypothetical protein
MFPPALYSLSARDQAGPLIAPVWFYENKVTTSQAFRSTEFFVPSGQMLVLQAASIQNDAVAGTTWDSGRLELQSVDAQLSAQPVVALGLQPMLPHHLSVAAADQLWSSAFTEIFLPPRTRVTLFAVRAGVSSVATRFTWWGYMLPIGNVRWQ